MEKRLVHILTAVILATNLSQLPVFVSTNRTQLLNMPLWILLFAWLILSRQTKVNRRVLAVAGSVGVVVLYACLGELFTRYSYLNSGILSCLLLSGFVFVLGSFAGKRLNSEGLEEIALAYVLSALIVSAVVYLEFFFGGFSLNTALYAYASKNSVSQIIFTSIILLLFLSWRQSRFLLLFRIAGISFQVFLLMILRSRATIIGFFVSLIYIIFTRTRNRRLKYALIALCTVFALALLISDQFNRLFINNILLAGRKWTDLDMFSSGRMSILLSFPERIRGHWLSGIGAVYFECFPLSAILNFGVFIGVFIIGIAYLPLFYGFRWRKYNLFTELFLIISIGYVINSFFEGLAPIGPGTKCYFMWLLFGILSAQNYCQKPVRKRRLRHEFGGNFSERAYPDITHA